MISYSPFTRGRRLDKQVQAVARLGNDKSAAQRLEADSDAPDGELALAHPCVCRLQVNVNEEPRCTREGGDADPCSLQDPSPEAAQKGRLIG
jgi:hypothetical protein